MKVHFIAIGGSAMHNLALALHKIGYQVSGSDDAIFEPSRSRLEIKGLLPTEMGWFPSKIDESLDAIILGMHAREDNPELIKAQELGLKVYSYPEYLYECAKDKKRVVIGGSHGKTTITSMLLHVLHYHNIPCDYMVGAQLEGFDTMVQLSDAPLMILEGDEYLSSPIDRRPKFHLYKAHIGLISGIAWDHINVFPTYENYVSQFEIFASTVTECLIYCKEDAEVGQVAQRHGPRKKIAYGIPEHRIENGKTYIKENDKEVALSVFGTHNLMNMEGARLLANELGISNKAFNEAIASFKGASKRLEHIASNGSSSAYKDFAHSPSKVKATTTSVKNQFPDRKLVACLELHTFSSLTATFLKEYSGALDKADVPLVYFNPKAIAHKKLPSLDLVQVKNAFNNEKVELFTDSSLLQEHLRKINFEKSNLLFMTSGNFDGVALDDFAKSLIH